MFTPFAIDYTSEEKLQLKSFIVQIHIKPMKTGLIWNHIQMVRWRLERKK